MYCETIDEALINRGMFELPRVNHWSPPTESNNAWVGLTLVSLAPTQGSLKHVSGSKCHTNARVGLAHQISNLAAHPTVVNNDFQELRIAACIPRSSLLSVAAPEGLFLMLACWRHVGPVSRVSTQRWRCLSCPVLIQKMMNDTTISFL